MQLPKTYEVLKNFGEDFCNLVRERIQDLDGIAKGTMLESIDWKIEETEEGLTLYMVSVEHFKYWDQGTKPHFPWDKVNNMNPLEEWVVDKHIVPVVKSWDWVVSKSGVKHINIPEVRRIAFFIGMKIKANGTEGRNAFEYAYNNLIGFYEPKIVEAFTQDTLEEEGILLSINNTLRNFL